MRDLSLFLLIFTIFCCVDGQDSKPAFCYLPQDEGTGTEVTVYLYYDNSTDKCFPFRYSGIGGNDNRFTAEHHCMRNCSERAELVYPKDRAAACHFPKAPGDCLGNYLRYYYDPVHGKCKTFSWTGCVGNGNRFLELNRCNDTCFGVKDENDSNLGGETEESDTPVGIILGVVLGIIGAIILIVVLVLTLKNKSSSKKGKEKQTKAKEDTNPPVEQSPLQKEKIEMA